MMGPTGTRIDREWRYRYDVIRRLRISIAPNNFGRGWGQDGSLELGLWLSRGVEVASDKPHDTLRTSSFGDHGAPGVLRRKQSGLWSLTMPQACIQALAITGPTKLEPPFVGAAELSS